jgi:lipoate-protein ligase A
VADLWEVRHLTASPGELHGRDVDEPPRRQVLVMRPASPALVLGSTQPDDDVDHRAAEAAGIAVVRRRSGGGAVLVEPGDLVWIDVVVPREDLLWDDDVGRASHWLGEAWAEAILEVTGGVVAPTVHRSGLRRSALSPVVCFAGLGPGELTVDGRKVVGLSQRRTRAFARFQTSVPLLWDAARHAELLGPGVRRALDATGDDRDVGDALGALAVEGLASIAADAVAEALVGALRSR